MLMRSGSSCNKGRFSAARFILLLTVSFVPMCITACGEASNAKRSSEREPSALNETVVVTNDAAEEKTEPVNTAGNTGETAAQAPTGTDTVPEATVPADEANTENDEMKKLRMQINGTEAAVSWEDNESVAALTELAVRSPITVQMSIYGGFEQVGPLGTSLPRNDQQTTTSAGDIVLYSGNQIVVFYGSNSWSYTRLGHVDLSAAEMTDLLSRGDVIVSLSAE